MRRRLPSTLLALTLLLAPASASLAAPGLNSRAPRLPAVRTLPSFAMSSLQSGHSSFVRHPGLPDTLRVLAIRVDFAQDTLETTTGDGSFLYARPDSIPAEDWVIDPPPHDRSYFADQLLAARLYFERFSRGKLVLTGAIDSSPLSGGDIFPAEQQAAYRVDDPIWTFNYGNDDDERLNRRLTELFRDSWLAAADSGDLPALANYDLFVIFHAGAGNEFDTGFDTTPHDIPSVYIGPEDLETYLGSGPALQLPTGSISRGVILPEMQRQEDIEVGMYGTVVHMLGFAIGLPHLYNTDNGDPGIGMLGVMDRGFGGFFGVIPTPPSAWTRAWLGWDSVYTVPAIPAEGDTLQLGARHLPDSLVGGDVHRLVRVPINEQEYYLLEARRRDPDDDSTTYALDREGYERMLAGQSVEGHRILFYNDYSFEAERDDIGAPVWVEDQDFDLPSSGLLIWHIDDSVIRARLATDDLQTDPDRRAVDLEEADGTEDIGEEYGFLQPGDGAEYGVREDAFFRDNEVWKQANDESRVSFGPLTAPATSANDGGASQLAFGDFSEIRDTMSVLLADLWHQGNFPFTLPAGAAAASDLMLLDLDGDSLSELLLYAGGLLHAFDGDGSSLASEGAPWADFSGELPDAGSTLPPPMAAADLQGSGADALYAALGNRLVRFRHAPGIGAVESSVTVDANAPVALRTVPSSSGGSDSLLLALYLPGSNASLIEYSGGATPPLPEQVALGEGAPRRGWLLAAGELPGLATVALLADGSLIEREAGVWTHRAGFAELADAPLSEAIAADLDGDGLLEQVGSNEGSLVVWWGDGREPLLSQRERLLAGLVPADPDGDGLPELYGADRAQGLLLAVEASGVEAEDSRLIAAPDRPLAAPLLLLDHLGRGEMHLFAATGGADSTTLSAWSIADGRPATGFPLSVGGPGPLKLAAGQLDEDSDIELVSLVLSAPVAASAFAHLRVHNLPSRPNSSPSIAWGGPGGGADRAGLYALPYEGGPITASPSVEQAYIWPNPVTDDIAHLRITSASAVTARVAVYDAVGRKLLSASRALVPNLQQDIELNVAGLPSGVYAARVHAGGASTTIRFAVVQ